MNTLLCSAHIWKTLQTALLYGQIPSQPDQEHIAFHTAEKTSFSSLYWTNRKLLLVSISIICDLVTWVHFRAMPFLLDSWTTTNSWCAICFQTILCKIHFAKYSFLSFFYFSLVKPCFETKLIKLISLINIFGPLSLFPLSFFPLFFFLMLMLLLFNCCAQLYL